MLIKISRKVAILRFLFLFGLVGVGVPVAHSVEVEPKTEPVKLDVYLGVGASDQTIDLPATAIFGTTLNIKDAAYIHLQLEHGIRHFRIEYSFASGDLEMGPKFFLEGADLGCAYSIEDAYDRGEEVFCTTKMAKLKYQPSIDLKNGLVASASLELAPELLLMRNSQKNIPGFGADTKLKGKLEFTRNDGKSFYVDTEYEKIFGLKKGDSFESAVARIGYSADASWCRYRIELAANSEQWLAGKVYVDQQSHLKSFVGLVFGCEQSF